ncbi:uncharacterized protein LOC120903251 isoform X1 [Anopheles arabiensis]|uniref:MD-2-related lipid-recognition domain-containing protein n=1 Tax=Anopheles arabiensis TaxID=7173 RepID=A0A2C9GRA8_ANOAR|nr:uncharacterized protein LOC120903251 isoform X1 [Anopheles arabiensis]XP_040168484.1 uncharacterized protein LOC120903251 isoform X1 [Anopheles arabiensis]
MNEHCWVRILTIVLLNISLSNGFVTVVPIINKMDCKFNARIINLTCTLNKPNTFVNQTVSMEMEIMREVKDVKLAAAYYVVSGSGDSSRLVQRTVDLCSYVRHPNRDRLVKVIFDRLKEEGNYFVTKCPIPRNEKFYIRNLRPTSVQIPGFIPESSFIFENIYQIGALFEPVVEVRYYGKLVRVMNKDLQKPRT